MKTLLPRLVAATLYMAGRTAAHGEPGAGSYGDEQAPEGTPSLTFSWVEVGDPGNPPIYGRGSVGYRYKMMQYEVTNAQYCVFLNAVDPNGFNTRGLYNTSMGSAAAWGGIVRTSSAPIGQKYSVLPGMASRPVNYVSWFDVARFTNWLNNGQGSGSTETGAYDLVAHPDGISATAAPDAAYRIPTENEWWKAAFYDPVNPEADAGGSADYWIYPTKSDIAPTTATVDANGVVTNPGSNVANYDRGAMVLSNVGSAGAVSHYGIFDLAGNVAEWADTVVGSGSSATRNLWGGGFYSEAPSLYSPSYPSTGISQEDSFFGFRLVAKVDLNSDLTGSNYEAYYFGTLAGNAGYGINDGVGRDARFYNPHAVAVDTAGNAYVADSRNSTIRKITPDGRVSTFAGLAGHTGSLDGVRSQARFAEPYGVAVDSAGFLYVADSGNATIRKISPEGAVTTLAGMAGQRGANDGTGSAARFSGALGVAVDSNGNVYVGDTFNNTIRKITTAGVVSTLAGFASGFGGSDDGVGSAARFDGPIGVAVDGGGNVYVADQNNHTIRHITPGGMVSTLAGAAGSPGSADAKGINARFSYPRGVAVDSAGTVYVADSSNSTLRKINPDGIVSTVAGLAGNGGTSDGVGSAARFAGPPGVAVDSNGIVYVADGSHTIRKVSPGAVVSTLAGLPGGFGTTDGSGSAARFKGLAGVAAHSSGVVYVADTANHTIRAITPDGVVSTLAGSAGNGGVADGSGSAARFFQPGGVAVDEAANVYVADTSNHTIRKIGTDGVVSTLAGLPGAIGSADGAGSAARFHSPRGIAADSAGNLYVADSEKHTIRKITSAGVVTTFAGLAGNYGSVDGTGNAARFFYPYGVAVDGAGNVYVADRYSHVIRRITPDAVVNTLAGLAGVRGSADGTGDGARFNDPQGIAVDSVGNVYVAEAGNLTVRKITAAGTATTLGGVPAPPSTNGLPPILPIRSDEGSGSGARFYLPSGIAAGSDGRIYVADTGNNVVRVGLALRQAGASAMHGTSGLFSLDLGVAGAPTVESRRGTSADHGDHTLVLTFARKLASGAAAVTLGAGDVVGSPMISNESMTVELTGVADAQTLTLTLSSLSDTQGRPIPDTAFRVRFLVGDANGDGVVNAGDAIQSRNRSGEDLKATNFRCDINADGLLNSGDAAVVRSRSGNYVP